MVAVIAAESIGTCDAQKKVGPRPELGWRNAMRLTAFAMVLTSLTWLNLQQPGSAVDRDAAIRLFRERVDAYAALHRRLETPLPTLTQARDMRRNFVVRQLLASAIRRARGQVRQGNIFAPDAAIALRAIISEALSGRDVESFLAELNEEHPQMHDVRAVINGPLPRGSTHEVPVVLLQVLPELPEDVEYRIVNHDLVLWDIHADLVVDYLPNAFRAVETT
jgi:hypothetical protein